SIDRPQVVAVLVVGTILEQRDEPAVGRQLGLARCRAAERRTGEYAFEGDVLGESRRANEGEEQQAGDLGVHGQTVRAFAQKKRRSANAPPFNSFGFELSSFRGRFRRRSLGLGALPARNI